MKRALFLLALLALLLAGCQAAPLEAEAPEDGALAAEPLPPGEGGGSRPLSLAEEKTVVPIPETPSTASFFLTYWDGETLLEQFCYSQEDLDALAEALPEVRGRALLEPWVPSPNPPANGAKPWPVYGLRTGGVERDFEAAYTGGVWLDNQGHILRAEVDFPALWERFARDPQERDPLVFQPAQRELSLGGGGWDPRFLQRAEEAPSDLVPMELTLTENGVDWTVTNRTGTELTTGNGSTAMPQVLLDGVWYNVPALSGAHCGWTLEAYSLPPGETFSGTFWQAPFGPLPDGDYRLVLDWTAGEEAVKGFSAAPFQVQAGAFVFVEP